MGFENVRVQRLDTFFHQGRVPLRLLRRGTFPSFFAVGESLHISCAAGRFQHFFTVGKSLHVSCAAGRFQLFSTVGESLRVSCTE